MSDVVPPKTVRVQLCPSFLRRLWLEFPLVESCQVRRLVLECVVVMLSCVLGVVVESSVVVESTRGRVESTVVVSLRSTFVMSSRSSCRGRRCARPCTMVEVYDELYVDELGSRRRREPLELDGPTARTRRSNGELLELDGATVSRSTSNDDQALGIDMETLELSASPYPPSTRPPAPTSRSSPM